MIHPDTELRKVNDTVGYGVFATRAIAKGTIVYVKDALEITLSPADYMVLPKQSQWIADWYSYIDERGDRIISWDIAKYVNHSCQSNTVSTGYGFEIAVRNIEADEEITDEYGIFNLTKPLECCCGSPDCRKVISNQDWAYWGPIWNERSRDALSVFNEVKQPLIQYLDTDTHRHLVQYLHGQEPYRSIQSLRYLEQRIENTA